jgi:hypothetical protein
MVAKYAAPPSGPTLYDSDGRRDIILPFTSRQDSLVRMAVAPFPVIPLLFLLEFVVFPVLFVPLLQIMPVGAILTLVPVVIVLVVPIVNSYLDVLRRPGGHHRTSGRKSSR